MGYRQYPRLSEQLSFVVRGISGAQARPTEGQMLVLNEVGAAIEEAAGDLQALIAGAVADLNRMVEGQPAIRSGWSR